MLLKFYNYLQAKIASTETRLATKLDKHTCDLSVFSLFSYQLILLNQLLVIQSIALDIVKYFIILTHPHSDSFIVLFHQKELHSCEFSYHQYKTIQKKVRTFSLAGSISMVTVAVLTSLITNLIFGGALFGRAQVYGWIQNSWSGNASTTAVANHDDNQMGWSKWFYKDANVVASTSLSLNASSGSFIDTSDVDFNSASSTNIYISGGSIILLKPNGASCSAATECSGGACASNLCATTCSASTPSGQTCAFDGLMYGVITGADGRLWLDRNLGASAVATAFNDSAAYGWYYQWGRLTDGHQYSNSGTSLTLAVSDTPGHSNFIRNGSGTGDWRNPQNDLLWQGVSGTNNPCPSGYRIPTQAEWANLFSVSSITNYTTAFNSALKLVATGNRNFSTGALASQGVGGYYWSSSINTTSGVTARFDSANAYTTTPTSRANGEAIRCIKN